MKYLAGQSDIIKKKRKELENSLEQLQYLEKEHASLRKEITTAKQFRANYERSLEVAQEAEDLATQERDESNKALKEMVKAVSLLVDPNAPDYEIKGLDVHSRMLLTVIASRGRRILQKRGIDLNEDIDSAGHLPEEITQELSHMLRYMEEEWER